MKLRIRAMAGEVGLSSLKLKAMRASHFLGVDRQQDSGEYNTNSELEPLIVSQQRLQLIESL